MPGHLASPLPVSLHPHIQLSAYIDIFSKLTNVYYTGFMNHCAGCFLFRYFFLEGYAVSMSYSIKVKQGAGQVVKFSLRLQVVYGW